LTESPSAIPPSVILGPQVEFITRDSVTWVSAVRPTEAESELLVHRFGLRADLLAEALLDQPTVRSVDAGEHALLSLAYPSQNRLTKSTNAIFARLIVGADFVICVHRGDARPIARLFRDCQADEERLRATTGAGAIGLATTLIRQTTEPAMQSVDSLKVTIDELCEAVADGDDLDLPSELAIFERDVAALSGILRSARVALVTLGSLAERFATCEDAAAVASTRDRELLAEQIERALDVADLTSSEAAGLGRACGVLAAQRTVGAARLTAGLLATLLPAVVVGALFGANVKDLPLADYPYAFEVFLGTAIAVALFALWQLRRRRWV